MLTKEGKTMNPIRYSMAWGWNVQLSPRPSGIAMSRTVLSALPEMSSLDVGLNFNTVGGNSCDLRMFKSG